MVILFDVWAKWVQCTGRMHDFGLKALQWCAWRKEKQNKNNNKRSSLSGEQWNAAVSLHWDYELWNSLLLACGYFFYLPSMVLIKFSIIIQDTDCWGKRSSGRRPHLYQRQPPTGDSLCPYNKSCTDLWMCCRMPHVSSRELLSKCNSSRQTRKRRRRRRRRRSRTPISFICNLRTHRNQSDEC